MPKPNWTEKDEIQARQFESTALEIIEVITTKVRCFRTGAIGKDALEEFLLPFQELLGL